MSSYGRVRRTASCPCARNQLDKRLLSAQQYSKSLMRPGFVSMTLTASIVHSSLLPAGFETCTGR
eukprot:3074801-Heterocapsa_arctica.AAC.1